MAGEPAVCAEHVNWEAMQPRAPEVKQSKCLASLVFSGMAYWQNHHKLRILDSSALPHALPSMACNPPHFIYWRWPPRAAFVLFVCITDSGDHVACVASMSSCNHSSRHCSDQERALSAKVELLFGENTHVPRCQYRLRTVKYSVKIVLHNGVAAHRRLGGTVPRPLKIGVHQYHHR